MSHDMGAEFPKIDSYGKPTYSGNSVTFSYFDTTGHSMTETRPVLTPEKIVALVKAREARFEAAPPNARESDSSRSERKYIAAQPAEVLHEAFDLMGGELKAEFAMMLDVTSHHSISDPKWIAVHVKPTQIAVGDDRESLCEDATGIIGTEMRRRKDGDS